ncbi:MAG: FAD-dependent oxidoreductase [Bacteroidales bacterium]|nr:FAD-dependent oxidoreductase [Bacteroidales bacterium]
MQRIAIDLTPEQYHIADERVAAVARQLHVAPSRIGHIEVVKRSIDSRRGQVKYSTQLDVYDAGETFVPPTFNIDYPDCSTAQRQIVIVGAGPAGLFAALRALQHGVRPVIVERGKPVEERKRDVALLGREGILNPDSNWCFGEGGAGTFSDGKLYTRSTKRGDVSEVLRILVAHGADPSILIDAHAHIGTDMLSPIIANIRHTILDNGGQYLFGCHMNDLLTNNDRHVCGIRTAEGQTIEGDAVILATGHSARDIYELFHRKGWMLQAKPFALGVRVEHPQQLINSIQYHSSHYSPYLPPATYSLTAQVEIGTKSGRGATHGVFSFCMCPGGVIVPAATAEHQQVVNGMSNSKRNSPYANSGIAVTVCVDDVPEYTQYGEMALLRFQQDVERRIYEAGQAASDTKTATAAPSQRLTDFCEGRTLAQLNKSNYLGTCVSAPLHELLPPFVTDALQQGFRVFDRKMRGFYTEQASIVAVESRTSSPIRIPRGADFQHPQLRGLYPCGEGAGYAGGIVSSALDGINAVNAWMQNRT